MNSVTLLALLIITCTSRAGKTSYWDFTELVGEHFPNEFFEDEVAYTSKSEDSSQGLTTTESFETNPTHFRSLQQEDEQKRGGAEEEETNNGTSAEDVFKHSVEDPTTLNSALNEVNVDKEYSHFIVHPFDYHNSKTFFQNVDPESDQTLKRREVKEWRVSDDIFDTNNVPWGPNTYFSKLGQSASIEDNIYSEDKTVKGPLVIVAGDFKDHDANAKHPQYFQKNYYYNYYPLVNDQKKWNSEEIFVLDDPKRRKYPTTNPCKQYLEFLKYAFERIDENSEYDEINGEHTEDYRGRDSEAKIYRVFGTQLLGPTFYIDNSGKISQVNTNGNSVQVVEGISPETRISVFSKNVPKVKTVTLEIPTTEPSTTQTLHFIETETTTTQKHTETATPTIPPRTTERETEKQPITTTAAPIVVELSTTEETEPTTVQEYYGRMGGSVERKISVENQMTTTTTSSPQRTTILPVENRISIKTVLRIENSTTTKNKSDDVDCKDKMLPCPDTVNITYPLNGYCNRYVSCESGRAIRRTCPEGLHFNLVIKGCDLPHNSFCTYVCPQPNGNFGIPGDCGGYFVCKNSNPEYRMCPPRMHWDIGKGICTFAQLSSCPMKCFSDNEVRHYEGDCKAYIVCLNGIPYYHKCPPNTKFDRKSLICIPDHLSKCVDDPRLLTHTLNANVLCKDVEMQLNTKSWCRAFLPFDKDKS